MRRLKMPKLPIFSPDLQIDVYGRLNEIRKKFLIEALGNTIKSLKISEIDAELEKYVSEASLNKVASFGIRGEFFFPVPLIIRANPYLHGYYRLLYGISQKEMYNNDDYRKDFGKFKRLENTGKVSEKTDAYIEDLCVSLIATGELFLDFLDEISISLINELQLLTLGPQIRGSINTKRGSDATQEAINLITTLVKPYIQKSTGKRIIIKNDSERQIKIEFLSDPDVKIEEMVNQNWVPKVAMEIKGGKDKSNVWNRIGEAEKSQLAAAIYGFAHRWTIVRVDIDEGKAREASPSTTMFFNLDRIQDQNDKEHSKFIDNFSSILGIRVKPEEGQ